MSTQRYLDRNFKRTSLELIGVMNGIVDEYIAQNYRLTVRQLYYQLVARGVIPNTERSYKNTTSLVNDAKLAGLMDWEAIQDRTREFIRRSRWESASEIVRSAAQSFHMDLWRDQPERVFMIVEKEALVGVLERDCRVFDVPLLAARGYPSGTVLREFSIEDVMPFAEQQDIHILHLGDHDPSGIDMTRDLTERIAMFSEATGNVTLTRIALTMDQIKDQKPPPNPAKSTDARYAEYRRRFGTSSWELDALKPEYLSELITRHISDHIDFDLWDERKAEIEEKRKAITKVANKFEKDNA